MRSIPLLALFCLLTGCAKHEFDLAEPADLAQHVGRDQPTLIDRPPLTYRLQAAEGRLVMTVRNPSAEPVVLLGEQSYVVDPDGESHPLPTQTIAPGSFIKLIFPPMRDPRAEPRFGIGIGVMGSAAPSSGSENSPALLSAKASNPYWTWKGETPVRMRLAFKQGERTFAQEFVFQRVKA